MQLRVGCLSQSIVFLCVDFFGWSFFRQGLHMYPVHGWNVVIL